MDGAGVRLTRVVGQPRIRHLDPFVLLDRFHSSEPRDYIAGFPSHPHRGFETVTIMLDGNFQHRDSRGNHGLLTGGGAQWMTAGRGIVHSEMPAQTSGLLSGFQLWVNLPEREKMCTPYYQDLAPSTLHEESLSRAGSRVRAIAAHTSGLTGPVRDRPTHPTLLTLDLEDDTPFDLDLPRDDNAFVFVHRGSVLVADESVPSNTLAVLTPGTRLRLRAVAERSGVLVVSGRPLHEPIVQRGPFVMTNEADIERAWADYRAGTLG